MTTGGFRYPEANRLDLVERLPESSPTYDVADPYRWLEEAASADTERWSAEQDALFADASATWPARDHLRARQGWRRLFVSYGADHEAVALPDAPPDMSETMQRSIDRLPEAQRSILRLSLEGNRSYEDMARLMRSSVSSVKSRLHRARENLRSLMLTENSE